MEFALQMDDTGVVVNALTAPSAGKSGASRWGEGGGGAGGGGAGAGTGCERRVRVTALAVGGDVEGGTPLNVSIWGVWGDGGRRLVARQTGIVLRGSAIEQLVEEEGGSRSGKKGGGQLTRSVNYDRSRSVLAAS
jgi:hypothetical protein